MQTRKRPARFWKKFLSEQPDHPGIAHYIIHAYDYPPLASDALDAARSYAKIAPDSPHALHMPSHIFTRLGLWQESIESNLASEAAAQKYNAPGNELHARDYLVYAYLQGGQDRAAKKVIDTAPPPLPKDPQYFNGLYATGTMSPRYAVERHQLGGSVRRSPYRQIHFPADGMLGPRRTSILRGLWAPRILATSILQGKNCRSLSHFATPSSRRMRNTGQTRWKSSGRSQLPG